MTDDRYISSICHFNESFVSFLRDGSPRCKNESEVWVLGISIFINWCTCFSALIPESGNNNNDNKNNNKNIYSTHSKTKLRIQIVFCILSMYDSSFATFDSQATVAHLNFQFKFKIFSPPAISICVIGMYNVSMRRGNTSMHTLCWRLGTSGCVIHEILLNDERNYSLLIL